MAKNRKHTRYELKDGRKVVYRGITERDPEEREKEHNQEGKKFTHMRIIGPRVTEKTAEKWEEESLKTYRKGHNGNNPKYNKTRR